MENQETAPNGNTSEVIPVITKPNKPKYGLFVVLGILIFSLGILGGVLSMTILSNQKSPVVSNSSLTSQVSSSEVSLITSVPSSSTSSLSSSTVSSETTTLKYKEYSDKYVSVMIPTDATPVVDMEGEFNNSFALKYRSLDLHMLEGFCMDYNCDGHDIEYDLSDPLKLVWKYEDIASSGNPDNETGELITKRNGVYTLKKAPEKYISQSGNYLFLYSEEFKNVDNKKLNNFLVFLKKDGKYVALTWGGVPSFFNNNRIGGEYYYVKSSIKSSSDFKVCSEVLLKVLETFKKK